MNDRRVQFCLLDWFRSSQTFYHVHDKLKCLSHGIDHTRISLLRNTCGSLRLALRTEIFSVPLLGRQSQS